MKALPIGLALSGGTAKAIAHVGVLQALSEGQLSIDFVAGTSGGSIVAVLKALGMSIEEMQGVAGSLSWTQLASIKLTRLGIVSSRRIETLIHGFVGDKTFSDLSIPCAVTATDLITGEKRVFRQGSIARAVRASCTIPQIFLPVEIDGRYYVDGGLSEYLPIETVQEWGEQFTIGVHVSRMPETIERPNHIIQLMMYVVQLIARQNLSSSLTKADFVLAPDVGMYSAFDFGNAKDLMEAGYTTAKQEMSGLRRAVARKNRWLSQLKRRFSGWSRRHA